jgi:hypothetical protein
MTFVVKSIEGNNREEIIRTLEAIIRDLESGFNSGICDETYWEIYGEEEFDEEFDDEEEEN